MENKQEELKSAIDVLKKHGWYDPNVSAGNYRIPMPYVLRFMQEHTSDLQKQLKEKEQESIMLEKMCNRAQDHAEQLLKQLTKSNEMAERLAEALEDSVNGLIWFQEEYPSSYSENDNEHLIKCKDILTEYQNSKK